MKKILLVAALALTLGGCASFTKTIEQVRTVVSVATKSYTNPVTKNDLYKIESGVALIVDGLNIYRSQCIKKLVDTNCRANIAAIQVYTRQLPPLLTQLRGFVKNNRQIDAIGVYNEVTALIANIKTAASRAGIKIGGLT